MKHLSRTQITAYVEGVLGAAERQAVWDHQRVCLTCASKLRDVQRIGSELYDELHQNSWTPQDDLLTMLPGIMAEAQHPAIRFNRLAVTATILLLVVTLVPVLPLMRAPTLGIDISLLNVPAATLTPSQHETGEANPKMAGLRNTLDLEYASPVPRPKATAASSPEPRAIP